MADLSPNASHPIAIKALVVSLLVTTGIQAWQLVGEPEAVLDGAPSAVPAIFLNVTMPAQEDGPEASPSQEDPPEAPAAPAPLPASEPDPEPPVPETVTEYQAPLYRWTTNFTMEALLSATPLTFTPWTGSGIPFILLYYDGINDPAMLHNAYVFYEGGTGYNLCNQGLIRFWKWTAVEAVGPGTRLLYQNEPMPENILNLLGSGENCYTRLLAESSWKAEACMEGDGELAEPYEEQREDGTIVRHLDIMDYCVNIPVRFP